MELISFKEFTSLNEDVKQDYKLLNAIWKLTDEKISKFSEFADMTFTVMKDKGVILINNAKKSLSIKINMEVIENLIDTSWTALTRFMMAHGAKNIAHDAPSPIYYKATT